MALNTCAFIQLDFLYPIFLSMFTECYSRVKFKETFSCGRVSISICQKMLSNSFPLPFFQSVFEKLKVRAQFDVIMMYVKSSFHVETRVAAGPIHTFDLGFHCIFGWQILALKKYYSLFYTINDQNSYKSLHKGRRY